MDANEKALELIRTEIDSKVDAKIKAFSEGQKTDELVKQVSDLKTELAKAASIETLKELETKLGEISKSFDDFQTDLKNKGQEVKKMKGVREALSEAVLSKDVQDQIQAILKNGGKQTEPLLIKAAVTMGLDTTLETGATQTLITSNTGIVSTIRQRQEKYLSNVSVGGLTGKYALWVEETDEQGTPIFIGEGDTKTAVSVKYVEKEKAVGKIAVHGKVTTELMADAPQFITFIQNNLLKRVAIVTENQLLLGDGTGDNLTGLKTYAVAFSAGALANTVTAANEFDVLNAVALQVDIANGIPTAVFVHPSTIARMKTIKATDGTPLYKQYTDFSGEMTINGMKVVSTTAVPAGEFIGGDTSVANVLYRDGLSIQIGLDGNDFTQNKKTILVEQRLVQFVSANDVNVIVKGTFAVAKALLDPAVADS